LIPGRWFLLAIQESYTPKRLRRISNVCEDFGLRVQKSIFECWLANDRFEDLWKALVKEIDAKHDSLIAYTLDAAAAKARLQAGNHTILTEKRTRVIL